MYNNIAQLCYFSEMCDFSRLIRISRQKLFTFQFYPSCYFIAVMCCQIFLPRFTATEGEKGTLKMTYTQHREHSG